MIDISGKPIGIIGMCLTGVFPLALLGEGVGGAVLCQPTLPFTLTFGKPIGRQKENIGLDRNDLDIATRSNIPLLAMRYAADELCPPERIQALRDIFRERLASIEVIGGKGHSTLAGNFHAEAFADTIKYLQVRLGVKRGPKQMHLATLGGKNCEITADGKWRQL